MKVLITGGMGFVGSNLAHKCVEKGYTVTVLDAGNTVGSNRANIEDIEHLMKVVRGDVRDYPLVVSLIRDSDVCVHLAAQVSHYQSQLDPFIDNDINMRGTLNVLEAIHKHNINCFLAYASSRSVYGRHDDLPIKETSYTMPIDAYGITKLGAEKYVMNWQDHWGIKAVAFRMANLFGPRQQMKTREYQIISWILRRIMLNEDLYFWGDGLQKRDFMYVDDACEAYLKAMENQDLVNGRIYNLGGLNYMTFNEVFKTAEKVTSNKAKIIYENYPTIRTKLENVDSLLDCSKIKNELGWECHTTLEEGFKIMKDYYKSRWDRYLPDVGPPG